MPLSHLVIDVFFHAGFSAAISSSLAAASAAFIISRHRAGLPLYG